MLLAVQSLQKALGIASTAAGLEAALVMGLRVEGMHCQGIGYGPASPDWRQNVGQALINIQGRLPSSFTQTRAILARTSPNEVLAAAAARAYNGDSACMKSVSAMVVSSSVRRISSVRVTPALPPAPRP